MPINPGNTGPTSATHAEVVSPSDTVDLLVQTKGIWVGGVGNLTVIMAGGETVTYTAVAAGTYLPICVNRIKATLTTATAIVALWE